MKYKPQFVLLFFIVLLLSACSGNKNLNQDIAVAVALTQTAAAPPVEQQPEIQAVTDAVLIEFQSGSTTWYTNADLEAGASAHYILSGLAGQQVTAWLTPDPAPDGSNLNAALNITSADGQLHSTSPEVYWSTVLPSSQDYFIDITSFSNEPLNYQIVLKISPVTIDPTLGAMYDLIPDSLCQELGVTASEALGVDFTVQTRAPFFDAIAGEAGQGCYLGAGGNGTQLTNPQDIIDKLVNSVGLGWGEQLMYAAGGPTGSSVGLIRDMGLMLISAKWEPAMGVECPADQPISECNLLPEQKNYMIEINIAQYRADFSLDGQWEDTAANFTLNLYQDWKNITGSHIVVAQEGKKIDSLDISINGSLKGKVAEIQFQSSFTGDIGTAQITYLDVNTIQWKIITPPAGEYYLPAEATLTRN